VRSEERGVESSEAVKSQSGLVQARHDDTNMTQVTTEPVQSIISLEGGQDGRTGERSTRGRRERGGRE
jgi:hypothetical protein